MTGERYFSSDKRYFSDTWDDPFLPAPEDTPALVQWDGAK